MVLLNLTREQAEFLGTGMNLGIRGLNEETYPPFVEHLENIKSKLKTQRIRERQYGV